ncbi:MAG: FtsX-like permease family protein [Gemmatimonadaceae bacterium]
MRSPRWRKVVRDVWLHKARTLLVVLAICVGIIGSGAVLNKWALLRRVTHGEFSASNPASATLRTDSIDATLLHRVRALPAIRRAEARRTVTASARTEAGWRTALLFATEDFAKEIGVLKPEHGAWPPADGAIVVEASSVEFSGASIGQPLEIQVGDAAPVALTTTGIARDVGLAPGWMEHVVYAFVTPATLARLGSSASLNELQIVVRDPALDREAVRRVANEVRVLVEDTGRRVSDVDVPVPGRHIHTAQIDSLLMTQGAFGLLAMLMSGLLVLNLISAMLTGQVREIGIMKAIGARGGQIARMYLGLALGLGLVACAIAIPAAAVLGRLYAQFSADMLNFDITGFTIPFWAFGIQLAVGALLPVLAAAVPVRRGSRISVGDALRDFGILGRGDNATPTLLRRVGGVTRPLLLSLRNAFRRRQRMALTLVTLAMGGAVYLGALNLKAAIVASVDLLFGTQRFDIGIRFAKPYHPDSIEAAVSRVAGVARVEAWSSGRAALRRADGSVGNAFPLTAPPADTRMLSFDVVSGRGLQAGDANALVVNRRLIEDDSSFVVGREVTLVIAGRPTPWIVVGVAETGPSAAAYVPRDALAPIVSNGGASLAVVASALAGPASHLDLVQRIRSDLTDAGIEVGSGQLLAQQRRVVEDHLLLVAGFLGVMAQLMIVVGGLGLASTMSLGVLERTREIGVLRAIGARHRSILTMVQVEGLVIAVLSWLVAIPLSLVMSVALGDAFGRVMLKVPVILVPEAGAVLRWLAVVVVVSIAACAWPAYRAMRVSTRTALSYE